MLFPRVYDSIAEVLVALKMYVDDQVALLRARAILQLANLLSFILTSVFLIIGGAFFFLFLTVAFGMWMGALWGSMALGFLAAAGVWLLLLVVFYLCRRHLFVNPLLRRMHRFSAEAGMRAGRQGGARAAHREDVPYQNMEALAKYKGQLERKLKREEQIMLEGLQGLRGDLTSDVMDQVLSLALRFTSLRLFPRLFGRRRRG